MLAELPLVQIILFRDRIGPGRLETPGRLPQRLRWQHSVDASGKHSKQVVLDPDSFKAIISSTKQRTPGGAICVVRDVGSSRSCAAQGCVDPRNMPF